ncbi:diguanylate cyclase (GGDEF)-like protein [Pseudomonas fluvialis]|uniref:diguanylate cyclase n=1 Tax=Pseudomonas fluvialis TaxID=1793966 RepID=A0A7X0BTD2_9PSED|nr:sensor domain-containing diguanylate cyclase [Pseudomonas fluvialis]MBB6342430.1 diguanylate cyclase (GGDEF)-like protein [Pseudomonas fluvialis]
MLINSKKRLAIVVIGLAVLLLTTNIYLYQQRVTERRLQIENIFASRAKLLSVFLEMRRDQVSVMSNLLIDGNLQARQQPPPPLPPTKLHPELGIWHIDSAPGREGQLSGALQQSYSADQRREIQATLALDPLIREAMAFNQEVAWIYYLSASSFIYLAPDAALKRFHFSAQLYQRAYWLGNLPQANPRGRLTIHGPYADLAGKGQIMTFSQPIYVDQQFLGVTALDLRIDTLQQLLDVGESTGESLLLSDSGQVIARQGDVATPTLNQPPISTELHEWRTDAHGNHWLSTPLIDHELWLVHQVKRHELEWDAFLDSLPGLLLSSLLALFCLLAWRLMDALGELTRLTHTDPLTQTLNRRGFYEQAGANLAIAQRENQRVAVLLMDIDFFKKINDQHGHDAGDVVLRQVGSYLLQGRRPFDLICRWGGEEFIALFRLPHGEDAIPVAERLRQQAQRTRIPQGDLPVTLSGGLVLLGAGEELEAAIKRADALLYRAKQNGRNRIEHEYPATAAVAG